MSSLVVVAPRTKVQRVRTVARPGGPTGRIATPHHVVDQTLFRDALARERKRADRFEQTFVLLLISLPRRTAGESPWAQIVDVLTHIGHDTDVRGWFEQGSIFGLIRPLVGMEPAEAPESVSEALFKELIRCLGTDRASRCTFRFQVYPHHEGSIAAPILEADRSPDDRLPGLCRRAAKRGLDIIGSAALLVALSPVFLIVAALVKLTSKGPVLFRQPRVGQHGRLFTMLKFRTMRAGAEAAIHQQYVVQFIQASAAATQSDKPEVFKLVNDQRVTPLGHFLRRSSLDELPQFWNVLTGEMSLVGPRPPLPYEVDCYKRWHRRRVLEAKPGVTGLWQVTGRSRTTFDEMVRLDLHYARHHSLWMDLKILLATPRAVISGNGAH